MSEKICLEEIYRQQYAHFGRMNDLLYKLPVIFSAGIGAFWYFGYQVKSDTPSVSIVVFIFSAALSIACFQVTRRFGMAFTAYIVNINKLDGSYAISLESDNSPSVINVIKFILLLSTGLSLLVAGLIAYFTYCPMAAN